MDGKGSPPSHPRIRGGRPEVESKPELADPPAEREHNGEGENRRASKQAAIAAMLQGFFTLYYLVKNVPTSKVFLRFCKEL